MKLSPTRIMLVVAGVLLLAVGGLYAVRWTQERDRTDLAVALAMVPDDAERFSWTDWAGVRAELGVDAEDPRALEELVSRGFDADLSSTSILVDSAEDLRDRYGFSPASVRWEMFSQSTAGMSLVVALDPDQLGAVAEGLRRLGYAEPDEAGGVWSAEESDDPVVANTTPELTFLTLDTERGLIIGSDAESRQARAVAAVEGDAAGPGARVEEVAEELGAPLSAALYSGAQACRGLAMGQADPAEAERGETLVEAAGTVNPLTGFGMGAGAGGDVRVVMTFETEDQARTNADSRAALASGEAPGQGGTFAERFELGPVTAEGTAVVMELDPVDGAFVISDLSNGPLLFATC